MRKETKKAWRRVGFSMFLLILCFVSMKLFERYPDTLYPTYRTFSKGWTELLSSLTGSLKIAVWDYILVVLILGVILALIHVIRRHKSIFAWFSKVLLLASFIVTEVILGWMLNHYAPSLNEEIGLEIAEYTVDELEEATEYYLLQASEYAEEMERDEEDHLIPPDFYEIGRLAGSSYEELGQEYPVLDGVSYPVKKLTVIGEWLMYNGTIGMYMPFTAESGVPGTVPSAPLAYTMCHEAAHRLGIAGEQEANLAAFLACSNSKELWLLYSGYYQAFGYCFNSLYKADSERALGLYEKYEAYRGVYLVRIDRRDTREVYDRYESKLQEVSDHMNDTYLKAFSEKDGVQSYGKVTDDLIALYQKGMNHE